MMDLGNLQLIDLQPDFLKADPSVQAICHALQPVFVLMLDVVSLQRIYTNIDNLEHWQLDEIAWGFDCLWYNPSDTLPSKRENIKAALSVFSKMGTASAIRRAVAANFGQAIVHEWFSYGGIPGNFKITIEDPAATNIRAAEFNRIVNEVKGARNVLEKIVLMRTSLTPMRIASVSVVTNRIVSCENLYRIGGASPLSIRTAMTSMITKRISSHEHLYSIANSLQCYLKIGMVSIISKKIWSEENG